MKKLYTVIGAIMFWLWIAGVFDLIDFRLCIGPTLSCNPPVAARWTA